MESIIKWMLLVLFLSKTSLGWVLRQRDRCDIIPIEGCSCHEPERPFVTCQFLDIRTVPRLLKQASIIHTLDMSHNRIFYFEFGAFSDTQKLERLSLAHNEIEDSDMLNALLPLVGSLKWLDLSHNYLHEIPNVLYKGFYRLKTLHLSFNSITTLGRRAFKNLPSLQQLYLDNNPITIVGSRVWKDISPQLWMLKLSITETVKIKKIISRDLKNVKALSIADGKRMKFINIFKYLVPLSNLESLELKGMNSSGVIGQSVQKDVRQRIKRLFLSNNGFVNVPVRMLHGFVNLEQLGLSKNLITKWKYSNRSQYNLPTGIRYLDLADNNISFVDSRAVMKLENLQTLTLTNNKIKQIKWNVKDIDSMGNSFTMMLGTNPWACNCRNSWLKELISRHALSDHVTHLKMSDILHSIRCGDKKFGVYNGSLIADVPKNIFTCGWDKDNAVSFPI